MFEQAWWTLPEANWLLIRGSGLVAYVVLSASVVTGLMIGMRQLPGKWRGTSAIVHESSSRWALWLTAVHGILLTSDAYLRFTFWKILWPVNGPYRPAAVTLGAVATWGMLVVLIVFDLKGVLGNKLWRRLHGLSLPIYLAATLHGVFAGTDTTTPTIRLMYLLSMVLVIGLCFPYIALLWGAKANREGRGLKAKGGGRHAAARSGG